MSFLFIYLYDHYVQRKSEMVSIMKEISERLKRNYIVNVRLIDYNMYCSDNEKEAEYKISFIINHIAINSDDTRSK